MKTSLCFIALLTLAACKTTEKPQPHADTHGLTASLGKAQDNVTKASASATQAAGSVDRARVISTRIDDKAIIVRKWLEQ